MTLELIGAAMTAGARLAPCCEVVGLDPRTVQRWRCREGGEDGRRGPLQPPANQLSAAERARALALLIAPENRDLSPHQIVPRQADQGNYIASESTLYRILREEALDAHRERSQPARPRPRPQEHVATGPNQVWTWDITYLASPIRGQYFYLYLVLDIWSRKITGWAIHREESADHAAALFVEICKRQDLDPTGIVLHADNGGPMKGSTMLATLQKLGIVASFSRPAVSDDNPFSEALFRTFKFRPSYPDGPFGSIPEARNWGRTFVAWYNGVHLHSGIRFVTPDDRHALRDLALLEKRHRVYEAAHRRHPERWTGKTRNWTPITTVRLNPNTGDKLAILREAA